MTLDTLSERQRMIAAMVAAGYSNAEISSLLSVSEGNVRNRLTYIYNDLDIQCGCKRARLAAVFVEEKKKKNARVEPGTT